MKLHLKWMAVLAAAVLAGCQQKDNLPKGTDEDASASGLKAPVLSTTDATDIVLNGESETVFPLSLSWTKASDDAQVSYELYFNLASRDIFTSAQKIEVGLASAISVSQKALSDIAKALSLTAKTELQVVVYARASGNDPVMSNVLRFFLTPFARPFPLAIYLIGSATDYGWNAADGLEMPSTSSGIYKADGVALRVLGGAAFKFALSRDGSDPRFAGQAPGEAFGNMILAETGNGNDFLAAEHSYTNGTYTIEVNLNTLKLKLTRTGDITESFPSSVCLYGGCFDSGYNWNNPIEIAAKSEGVYEKSGISISGMEDWNGFKIYSGPEYKNPWYGMDLENSTSANILLVDGDAYKAAHSVADTQVYLGRLGYAPGTYTIKIDLGAKKLTATLESAALVSSYVLIGDAVGGWEDTDRVPLYEISEGIHQAKSVSLTAASPEDSNYWYGFKVCPKEGWSPQYCQKSDAAFGDVVTADDGAQFYIKDAGLESGTYDVTLNLNTMKLTVVSSE